MVMPAPTPKVPWANADDFANWREKPDAATLAELIGTARDQVLALGDHDQIANEQREGKLVEVVPPGWKRAQIGLVKDVWNARKGGQGGDDGVSGVPSNMPYFAPNYKRLVNPTNGLPGHG